jgi:hypothetical protein
MSAWRRRALDAFPGLRRELQRRDYSIYRLFFDLLPLSREAHVQQDIHTLRQIYGFAEWCFRQSNEALWNAAGVAFYEHIFDVAESMWGEIVPWIPPNVKRDCWSIWELQLAPEKVARLRELLLRRREGRLDY